MFSFIRNLFPKSGVLSDRDIIRALNNNEIVVDPINPAESKDRTYWFSSIQPSSIDVHLGSSFLSFVNKVGVQKELSTRVKPIMEEYPTVSGGGILLQPYEFVLASLKEYIEINAPLVGRLEGKSSIGRLALLIHVTAGYIDPGFQGDITLELCNLAPIPLLIYPGDPIAQISFQHLASNPTRMYGDKSYGSKYQHQKGPTVSHQHLVIR